MRAVVDHPCQDLPKSSSEIGWRRGKFLGKGSSGKVFVGIPRTPNLPLIAVKSTAEYAAESLKSEHQILANFRQKPGIIQCFGAQITQPPEHGGLRIYNLLLEYAPGGSLSNLIAEYRRLHHRRGIPESDVRAYTRMILEALSCIHSRGFVHCDIKPANILVFPRAAEAEEAGEQLLWRLKVADFGLAVDMSTQSRVESLGIRGTVRYMAPEMAVAGRVTPAMDIWSLGCTVVEMITGHRPWKNLDKKEVMARVAEGRHPAIPEELSAEGRDFLEECFVTSRGKRASAESLLSHPFVGRHGSRKQRLYPAPMLDLLGCFYFLSACFASLFTTLFELDY